jgi:hypothetical protein
LRALPTSFNIETFSGIAIDLRLPLSAAADEQPLLKQMNRAAVRTELHRQIQRQDVAARIKASKWPTLQMHSAHFSNS